MRPVYLRDEDRARGHALVVMLAYLLVQALASDGATSASRSRRLSTGSLASSSSR